MKKQFQRRIEDFICDKCGLFVIGSGYTNHCPQCLWSKHVDINPGDRLGECGGLMRPVSFEKKSDTYVIIHECDSCHFKRKNLFAKNDNFQVLLELSSK